jgi:hypothetical protein
MSIQAERQAQDHPAYDDALRQAVRLAAAGDQAAVYWNNTGLIVRPCADDKPVNAIVVCIAQRWNAQTVQLRFAGARSEWVHA